MEFMFTKKGRLEAEEILKRYPVKRAALLPVLWLVQDQEGYVSDDAVKFVAEFLEITPADVWGVVTFYTMFGRKQIGRHHIQVCTNLCCRLKGADWLLEYLRKKLGVNAGETTPDGKFHLSTVECLGSCGTAPMMQIDNDYHENLDAAKVDRIIERVLSADYAEI